MVPTVQSWKWPPGVDGARYVIVLPSEEKAGEATSWPLTRLAGDPNVSVVWSNVATSSSADWLEPLVHTIASSLSSGASAGWEQPRSGVVRAWPPLPARFWIQIWERT